MLMRSRPFKAVATRSASSWPVSLRLAPGRDSSCRALERVRQPRWRTSSCSPQAQASSDPAGGRRVPAVIRGLFRANRNPCSGGRGARERNVRRPSRAGCGNRSRAWPFVNPLAVTACMRQPDPTAAAEALLRSGEKAASECGDAGRQRRKVVLAPGRHIGGRPAMLRAERPRFREHQRGPARLRRLEQLTLNQRVQGSNPCTPTNKIRHLG
jgi:hypothetical protein